MKRLIPGILIGLAALAVSTPSPAAKVRIVTSTTDLASIANLVGGKYVTAESICRGEADPHFVEVLPSYMIKVAKADIYLKVGLDLDLWASKIIDGSRNSDLVILDCSTDIAPLEKPTGKVDASMGDVHPRGNPHYWLDPQNALIVAQQVTDALIDIDGDNADAYKDGYNRFASRMQEKKAEWAEKVDAMNGAEIITFHRTWPYFSRAFGVRVAGYVEPLPGIEPTPSHTAKLVKMMKERNINIIGIEPYFSRRTPEAIARQTGAQIVTLPPSVGGAPDTDDYFALIDTLLGTLTAAFGSEIQ